MVYGSIYGASRIGENVEESFNPAFAGPDGSSLMLQEALDIDQKMFNLFIEHDFLEAASRNNVELEAALTAVDESFVKDVWDKIVKIITDIKNKIVTIAKAASVKLTAFFKKDNAELIKKYKKEFDNAKQDEITIKGWQVFNAAAFKDDIENIDTEGAFGKACGVTDSAVQATFKSENTAAKMLSQMVADTTPSAFQKDAKKKYFTEPADTKASLVSKAIIDTLTNYSSSVSSVNDAKVAMNGKLDTMEKQAKQMKAEAEKGSGEAIAADCAKYVCTEATKAFTKVFNTQLTLIKDDMKQARKAFVYIASKGVATAKPSEAAKSETPTNEAAELMIEEAMLQDYVVDSFFEQYSYDEEELAS